MIRVSCSGVIYINFMTMALINLSVKWKLVVSGLEDNCRWARKAKKSCIRIRFLLLDQTWWRDPLRFSRVLNINCSRSMYCKFGISSVFSNACSNSLSWFSMVLSRFRNEILGIIKFRISLIMIFGNNPLMAFGQVI